MCSEQVNHIILYEAGREREGDSRQQEGVQSRGR